MEGSSQINKLAEHPFRTYLARQESSRIYEREKKDQPNSALRTLAPQELESLVAQHQQWLESSDYQKMDKDQN